MKLPQFHNYMNSINRNYGLNSLHFTGPQGDKFWFSYKTLIAFKSKKFGVMVIHENNWGPTTGKHLNHIDRDKSKRVDHITFKKLYDQYII